MSIFEQTQDLQWGWADMNEVTITQWLAAKQKYSKRMTRNWNANKKEINEGEMQIASVSRKKITNKVIYIETIDRYA